jgi:hypothetical protein
VIDVVQHRTARDQVVCGSGFDRVAANKEDVVAPDCERVVVFRGGTPSEYENFWKSFYASVPQNFFDGLQQQCLLNTSDKQAVVKAKEG